MIIGIGSDLIDIRRVAKVIERLILLEIDHKTAALMLYALQTASMNLKRTSLEPALANAGSD